jgi:hypothetical protein
MVTKLGESASFLRGRFEMQKRESAAGISLSKKWGKIRIFHTTILELGEPKYIRFLFNPEKKLLAVQSCEKKLAESFSVPKYHSENWEFKISSLSMLQMIWKTCEWEEDKTYRILGKPFSEYNLVEFNLGKASKLVFDDFEN